jgi:lipopolysaccharide export system protein LptA
MCKLFIKKIPASLMKINLIKTELTKMKRVKSLAKPVLLASLLLLPAGLVHSAIADIEQQIVIKAKRQATDLKNKIASYLDDVIITQGTLSISADVVQVVSEKNSANKIYIASGKPAIFKQLLDDGQPIHLKADEIKYDPSNHLITISGNASVSQEGSLVSGEKIIYNTFTEQLTAESKSNSDDSVTTILQPQLKDKN